MWILQGSLAFFLRCPWARILLIPLARGPVTGCCDRLSLQRWQPASCALSCCAFTGTSSTVVLETAYFSAHVHGDGISQHHVLPVLSFYTDF